MPTEMLRDPIPAADDDNADETLLPPPPPPPLVFWPAEEPVRLGALLRPFDDELAELRTAGVGFIDWLLWLALA